MTCREIRTDLIALLDQVCADSEVASHALRCNVCGRKLDAWRKLLAVLDQWKAPQPSSSFLSRLRNRIRTERESQLAKGFRP